MTNNSKTPAPATETAAVELSEAELDRAAGGAQENNSTYQQVVGKGAPKLGDGSVRPAGAQPNGILAALESAIHA